MIRRVPCACEVLDEKRVRQTTAKRKTVPDVCGVLLEEGGCDFMGVSCKGEQVFQQNIPPRALFGGQSFERDNDPGGTLCWWG